MDTWRGRIAGLRRDSSGGIAIMAAFGLLAFLGMASLAIDMGQLYYVRNQLQNAADASALAAAGNLIKDVGGVAVRDADAAMQAAMTVAQRQSELAGLTAVEAADRNDFGLTFGVWNITTGDPQTAWTEIGSTCASDSNANAVKVDLRRAAGLAYGPVTNIFASIFGVNTSQVSATATAYLGYSSGVGTGTVKVPLALPSTILTASTGSSGWFARIFGPNEAVATTTKTYVFRDTGGGYVNTSVTSADPLDPSHAYLFTPGSSDAVPGTIWDILTKVYDPTYTSSNPVVVPELKLGQRIYARSEFKYGKSYIGPIFQRLKKAYNYKTTGNADTAPPAGTAWRVTLPVYGTTTNPMASRFQKSQFISLTRLLAPFLPSEAYACYTMPPPKIYVNGFVNADITGVTYTTSCDDCNYTFPKTINGVTYANKKDCLTNYSSSTWNQNTVTIKNVTDASTLSPAGSLSGGPSNQDINPGATGGVGSLATIPRLVK
ncbi:MAG: pilus assembly protein TadG-related protein [Thermodesulfobacteriota bacterium]